MSSRRAFLNKTAGIAVLGGTLPSFPGRAAFAQPLPALGASVDPRNVLVVIQMGGGNDGLNTIVPYGDDAYHRVRPTIGIAPSTVIKIDDRIGLNPKMTALDDLYQEGHVAIVQGVGYPNPNRSHFEATQIWETASPDRPQSSGWLGRYLDRNAPNATGPASSATLFAAVSLGDTVPTALIAQHVDVPAIGALGVYGYNTGKDTASKATAGQLYDGAKAGQSPYLSLVAETAQRDARRRSAASESERLPSRRHVSGRRVLATAQARRADHRFERRHAHRLRLDRLVRHARGTAQPTRPSAGLPCERFARVLW